MIGQEDAMRQGATLKLSEVSDKLAILANGIETSGVVSQ